METKTSNFVLVVIAVSAVALAVGYFYGYFDCRRHTVGTDAIDGRYELIDEQLKKQSGLIERQSELVERITGEVTAVSGLIKQSVSVSERATERIQVISWKLESLKSCIKRIDSLLADYYRNNGGE